MRRKVTVAAGALILALTAIAFAWHDDGHDRIGHLSLAVLPEDVPDWFRQGGDAIAHLSIDPDVFRHQNAPQLTAAEAPEHYLDYEMLEGEALPPDRYKYLALCAGKRINPKYAGMLPYAITEWQQRLMLAFAEHRKWPDNPHIKNKCLVYAGILSHYSEDLCMPLHTTIHFDGRIGADGKRPNTGIHGKVDALVGKVIPPADRINAGEKVHPFDNVWRGVKKEFMASHALVDRVYELEQGIPPIDERNVADPAVREFTIERTVASSRFTARLFLTAWRDSATIKLHDWLERPPVYEKR